jgi:hypothetical protein
MGMRLSSCPHVFVTAELVNVDGFSQLEPYVLWFPANFN